MAYHAEITAETVRANISKRIVEGEAELSALKGIKINTKHNTLTNRAVEGATVVNYLGINKALHISYAIKYSDGHTKYEGSDITVYSYSNPDGTEIGSEGFQRISRTLTPSEVADQIKDMIESKASYIGDLRSEYRRGDRIAAKHNKLVQQIAEFNDSISYASEARI